MKLSDLYVKLGLKNESFNKGLKDSQNKTNIFGKGISKIGGLIAGAFAVGQIVSFGKELIELGGVAEGVRTAFERIAPEGLMKNLQEATAGTVGELELMKRAVMSNNFKIPLEQLGSLFEFATKRAQETGESVDFLVNSIVVGIGRKSPLILDNLGISAVELRQKLDNVGHSGATVGDVAKAVGDIARESMEKTGKIIDTNSIKVASLTAKWEDFKLSVAENETVINGVSSMLDDMQDEFEFFFSDNVSGWRKFWTVVGGVFSTTFYKNRIDELIAINNQLWDEESTEYRNSIAGGDAIIANKEEQIKTVGELKAETEELTKSLDLYNVEQGAELQIVLAKIAANKELIKQLTTLSELTSRPARSATPDRIATRGEMPRFEVDNSLADMDEFFSRMSGQLADFTSDYLDDWEELGESLDNLIVDGILSAADEFGEAIEAIFAGDFDIATLGGRMLEQIGSFLGDFGKLLIAYGIAQEAFWTSLGLGPIGAGLAIGAGVALIAIGGAIAGTGKRVSSGNLSAGGSGANARSLNVVSTNAQDRELIATVTYNQLAFILKKGSSNLSRV